MLFAIDHGNSAIKTPNEVFTSGLASYPIRPPVDTDVLEFEGTYWTLSGNRISYMQDKTKDDRFFILSLFAIAKELQRLGPLPPMVEADLAIGLPLEHYELREKFSSYFQRNTVQFTFNNNPVCLMIRHVFVYPQAYAAVVSKAKMLKELPRVFVVDIGGYTTDVLLLRYSKPDMQFWRSLEMGVISMSNGIIRRVNAQYKIKIEGDHILNVLQGRHTILKDEVKQSIPLQVKEYALTIIDKLRELHVDLCADPCIFVGGGGALFKPFIEESPLVSMPEFELDQKANAIGYAQLATAQLRRLIPQDGGDTIAQG